CAVLAERDPLRGQRPDWVSSSDVLDRLDALDRVDPDARRALTRVADQLVRLAPRPVGAAPRDEALHRAVLAGWPDRVARRRAPGSDRARMVGGKGIRLDPASAVTAEELFVAVDAAADGPDARVRIASGVSADWLPQHEVLVVEFDPASGGVRGRRSVRYRDLELASYTAPVPPDEAATHLAAAAAERLAEVWPVDGAFGGLRDRLRFVAALEPGAKWEVPWAELLPGLCRGCRTLGELRGRDWVGAVRDALGWSKWSELERLAPERITVPSGSRVAVAYDAPGPPVLAVRIQELFGSTATPTVGGGRIRVRLHLLGPNGRPQQITDDLAGFWDRTWPEVRKELRARYPKHAWPEDPRSAPPQSRPGRR
ncbi:MAG: ATP-dependent helicase C-terminal domain-containing protein, partial [Myxococcota bacterium]